MTASRSGESGEPQIDQYDFQPHQFEHCPECGGDLEYQTRADVFCPDCETEYIHVINSRADDPHVLWELDDDRDLDEVVDRV